MLENRQLMSAGPPRVIGVLADNRGQIIVSFNQAVRNLTQNTVKLFTAGADATINTADDERRTGISFSFNDANNSLTINGATGINQAYRIRLDNSITDVDGERLDGEFNGSTPSGNGVAGGNFIAVARRDSSNSPVIRMTTTAGVINVRLRRDLSAIRTTVLNFQNYANTARLDGTIFHRKVTSGIGIVQGGGFAGTGQQVDTINGQQFLAPTQGVTTDAPIALEAGVLSNSINTIAMARTNLPDSATSQFYFNAIANTQLDPSGGTGGFAAFGELVGQVSVATLGRIYAAPTVSLSQNGLSTTFSDLPRIDGGDVILNRAAQMMIVSRAV